MSPDATALVLSLALAVLVLLAVGVKPLRTAVSGFLTRDKKGRLAVVVGPAKKKRKQRKRR